MSSLTGWGRETWGSGDMELTRSGFRLLGSAGNWRCWLRVTVALGFTIAVTGVGGTGQVGSGTVIGLATDCLCDGG